MRAREGPLRVIPMRVFIVDISTSTGWAYLEGSLGDPGVEVLNKGTVTLGKTVLAYGNGKYPWNYQMAAEAMADGIMAVLYSMGQQLPDAIIVEETNLGKSRYSQKTLEFIHLALLQRLAIHKDVNVVYLSSSSWRSALGLQLTKEQKKANAKLSKAKREAAAHGQKLDKKALGIKGKVTKKHVAINYINERFGWAGTPAALKAKDDDVADAMCLGCAFFSNAIPCDGT